jgi:hypothetical protein
MKWTLLFLSILGTGWAQEAGVVLGRNRVGNYRIVTAPQAGPAEARAASELGRYLNMVCGPPAEEATVTIQVGRTAGAERVLAKALPATGDGFVIDVSGTSIVICGREPRGTVFGVYRFLERFCGCCWLAPGVDDVPGKPELTVPTGRWVMDPSFDLRLFNARGGSQRDWGLKMGMNGYYTQASQDEHGGCFYLPDQVPGCHAYHRIVPTDTYFEDHPEWFPLLNGKRSAGKLHGGQLCVTADGLADEFARNVKAVFAADPNCRIISISPNDGRSWCECDRCLALDKRLCGGRTTKQGLAAEQPFRGDRVFWFANEVARRVAEKYPDRLLLVLAYINYAEPPDTIKPLPNVVPYLCHYAPADYSRAIHDPASEANAQFDEILRRWAPRAPHLLFYSYVSKSMWWRLPRPVWRNFAADIRYLHSLGIRRYYCQSSLSDWALDGPLYYVLAKSMWDIESDPEALAHEWFARMFGPAAPALAEFHDAVEQSVRATGRSYSDQPPRDVPGLYDATKLDAAEQALARAAELATNEPYAGRVRDVAKVFSYGRAVIRGLAAEQRYREAADVGAVVECRTQLAAALKLYNRREVRDHLERLAFNEAIGLLGRGFGKLERKGDRDCWNTDETGLGDDRAGWATLLMPLEKEGSPVRLGLDVWGESALDEIVVNTGGKGRGYANGGIWKPVKPAVPLSGKPEWQRLVFDIPAELLPKGQKAVLVGMGGADSQIWLAKATVKLAE